MTTAERSFRPSCHLSGEPEASSDAAPRGPWRLLTIGAQVRQWAVRRLITAPAIPIRKTKRGAAAGGPGCTYARGFTIVELMITLAVVAFLAGVGIPAFRNFVVQQELTAQINGFVLAVNQARSESLRRRADVSVLAVDAADDANEWGPGFCVVVGSPANCDDALSRYEDSGANTLDGVDALDTVGILTFNGRGVLSNAANLPATIQLCSPGRARGRVITVSPIGRVQVQESTACPT